MNKLNNLRKVANIKNLNWEVLDQPGLPGEDVWWFNLSYDPKTGQGSYLYKMGPKARSNPHEHEGPEEFFIGDDASPKTQNIKKLAQSGSKVPTDKRRRGRNKNLPMLV